VSDEPLQINSGARALQSNRQLGVMGEFGLPARNAGKPEIQKRHAKRVSAQLF
jgi:hypothetical protein